MFCPIEIAELLVNHGADMNAKAHIGYRDKTPLDMATSPTCKRLQTEFQMNDVTQLISTWNENHLLILQ